MTNLRQVICAGIQSAWQDDRGIAEVVSYLVGTTLLGIGVIVGLATVRDQVVQGLGDIAQVMDNLNQSYSMTTGTISSVYVDTVIGNHPSGSAPEGISLTVPATSGG